MCGSSCGGDGGSKKLARAMEAVGREQVALGREELAWAKEMGAEQLALARDVIGQQMDIAGETQTWAEEDRARYKDTFGALEDELIADVRGWNTPERVSAEVGKAQADVVQAYDKVKRANARTLAGMGVAPSGGTALAEMRKYGVSQAKDLATAANQTRSNIENLDFARKQDVTNMGRGLPSQAAASYGIALNAGNSAVGNMNNTVGTVSNARGQAQNWYQGGANAMAVGGQLLNQAQANKMDAFGTLLGAGIGIAKI